MKHHKITTIALLVIIGSWLIQPSLARAGEDSGLLYQPWFKHSDFDLRKDLADAKAVGKTLAVLFEQRGCVYCQQMHDVNFKDDKIIKFITDNFSVVQLDFRGDREVIDISGERLPERILARQYQVNGTPNIVFFGKDGKNVFRMPGYAEPRIFMAVFEYVNEKAYEHSSIQTWFKNRNKKS